MIHFQWETCCLHWEAIFWHTEDWWRASSHGTTTMTWWRSINQSIKPTNLGTNAICLLVLKMIDRNKKKLQIPCMCSHVNMKMLQIVRCFTHTLNQQHRRSLQPAQFQGRDPRVWVCVCVYVCVCVCVCVRTCVCVWLIAGVFWVNWVNKCRLLRELIGSRSLKASSSPVGSPPSSRLTACLFVNSIFNKRPKKKTQKY